MILKICYIIERNSMFESVQNSYLGRKKITRSYTHHYLHECTLAHKCNCQSIKRCQVSCNAAAGILSITLMVDNTPMVRGGECTWGVEWTLERGRRHFTITNRQLYLIGTFYQTVYILQQVDTVCLPPTLHYRVLSYIILN